MQTAILPAAALAGEWFLASGIREVNGGVARYYRSDLRRNALVSTEITGYAISTLLYLNALNGERKYLDAAVEAGRFLTRKAWDSALGVFPFEHSESETVPRAASYFFDNGIILRALLGLARASGEGEFQQAAGRCARSMAKDFDAGRDFHPILALPEKQALERENQWSRNSGCYQLKAALGWLEFDEQTGQREYRRFYEKVLEYSLATHDSFLPGDPRQEKVMDRLHAYSYFLEGLLPVVGRPECAAALAGGIAKAASLLREIAPVFARSDVYAQVLRVRLHADRLGAVPLDRSAAQEEARAIESFQIAGGEPRLRGGFHFGRKAAEMLSYVNPVSTGFCLQALAQWEQYQAGEFQPAVRTLI